MPIKSFQGERVTRSKKSTKTLLVSDIMSHDLVVFTKEQTIHEVMKKFIKYRISGGPVVDDLGKLVGVISEADVINDFYGLCCGNPGRKSDAEITIFKNGGGAHLDLAVAAHVKKLFDEISG